MRQCGVCLRGLFLILVSVVCTGLLSFGAETSDDDTAHDQLPSSQDDWRFVSNDRCRVGIRLSSGGGIGWISKADSDENLIDHHDRGRLIQQSYYGIEDGSLWNRKPWRWNPVQGGDWQGKSAEVINVREEPHTLFVATRPMHWASGKSLDDCRMEQTISIVEDVIHIQYRFSYQGTVSHPVVDQELPAFFVKSTLKNLVIYEGHHPWTDAMLSRRVPGWPNQYAEIPEHWAAYVNDQGQGIGCFVPAADRLTFYRFGADEKSAGACSYFAPLKQFAVTPGLDWKYDAYITMGTTEEIRQRFHRIKKM